VIDAFSRIVRLGEGNWGRRPPERSGHGAHHRGAARLCQQAEVASRGAAAACGHRSLPPVGQRRRFHCPRCKETGLELEIIDRETEAHLAAAGAEPLLDGGGNRVVFDIGGGSTEVMWVKRKRHGR
jgi:exopolyphosphatase/guanosine-5'-triphosphate,3'-diphosphate pyrophosphatase